MSRASFAAYKRVKNAQHDDHLRKTYGMLPIRARHPGHCACGQKAPGPYGRGEQDCPFDAGTPIVKFRGAWWNTICVDRVKLAEWRSTCRFVRQVLVKGDWRDLDWSDEDNRAALWLEEMAEFPGSRQERVLDRKAHV